MKNRKGEITVGTIIILFIGIIVAFAFIQQIFTQQTLMTTKNPYTNDTIIIPRNNSDGGVNSSVLRTLTQSSFARDACQIDTLVVRNNTGTLWTSGTDYTFNGATGQIYFYNTSNVNQGMVSNSSYLTYNYCQEGYNQDASSRNVAGMIGLFSVLVLLAWVIWAGKINELLGKD